MSRAPIAGNIRPLPTHPLAVFVVAGISGLSALGWAGCHDDGSSDPRRDATPSSDADSDSGRTDGGLSDGALSDGAHLDGARSDGGLPEGFGHIVYHRNGHAYRITAQAGATPEDISAALDPFAIQAGEDGAVNISADGRWLLMSSERFHASCAGWACLVLIPADLSAVETIVADGSVIHPEGYYAVASGGDLILYSGKDGPHDTDIYLTRRSGPSWTIPEVLTTDSNFDSHDFPALSADGLRAVFDCGPLYGSNGLCEINTDGSGFHEVLMPSHVPPGMPAPAVSLHHPYYSPDGSIVFEGEWDAERIWRLSPNDPEPQIISSEFTNDNSPCVLPDGRVASLWLNRPDNPQGYHELKVMSADGHNHNMLVQDVNLDDWGLGCGR